MLAKPNEVAVRQLARLNSPEFDYLTGFFAEELAIIDQRLRKSSPDMTLILQGRAQQMEELLALIRKAPKMRDQKSAE